MNFRMVGLVGLGTCCLLHACGGRALSDSNETGAGGDTSLVAGQPSIAGAPPSNVAGAPPIDVAGAPSVAGAPGVAGAPVTPSPEQIELARIRKGIIGAWQGIQSNPWSAPCPVSFMFFPEGDYSAVNTDGSTCVALYYGVNGGSPDRRWSIDDVTAGLEGTGTLTIFFAYGDYNEGVMSAISLSADTNQLSFQVRKDGYGPLVYQLQRTQ